MEGRRETPAEKRPFRRGHLRIVDDCGTRRLTGEEVLVEGARMLASFLTRQLEVLPREDPDYAVIAEGASRFGALGALRSPQTPPGSPS